MARPATIQTQRPEAGAAGAPAVRWRAVFLGALLVACINGFDPVARYMIHSSSLTRSHMPFALLAGLLGLAYLYNPLVRGWAPAWALDRRDLAAVLAIGFLGSNISNNAQWLVGAISAPYYFASPENEWPTYVLPALKSWLIPGNAGGEVGAFYNGLPPGAPVPWGVWVVPLFWWFSLLGAIMLACFCLAVILRKQWSERERLAFPLVELPMLLVEDPEPGRRLPRFFRDRLFWIGFGIPAFMLFWNTTGHFYPGMPTFAFLNSNNLLPIGRGFMSFYLRFDFYVICFAYFTPLNILLSMWFFHVLGMMQDGFSRRIGFGPQGYGSGVITQNNYGLLVFVVWGLWIARGHFKDVWRKAFGKAPEVDDSEEILSYRTALFGLILSGLYIFFFICQTGLSPGMTLLFMFFTLVLYLGMAKIVALSGLISLRGSGPTGVVKELVGIPNMSDTSIAALNQMGALYGGAKGYAMPGSANAAKAAEYAAPQKRRLGATVFIGGMLSVAIFVVATLLLGYKGPGAQNFVGAYTYTGWHYDAVVRDIKGKAGATWEWWWTLGFGAFGAGMTGLLIFLAQRLPWWPLHPVGFTVSLQYPTRAAFFSVFIAWLLKSIVLRVGGNQLYSRSRVLVVGALLGYTLAVVTSFILDMIFFMGQGHPLHTPPM